MNRKSDMVVSNRKMVIFSAVACSIIVAVFLLVSLAVDAAREIQGKESTFPQWLVTLLDSNGDGFLEFRDTATTVFYFVSVLLAGALGAFAEKRHITRRST